jgi:hypothetical protein
MYDGLGTIVQKSVMVCLSRQCLGLHVIELKRGKTVRMVGVLLER